VLRQATIVKIAARRNVIPEKTNGVKIRLNLSCGREWSEGAFFMIPLINLQEVLF
jgi:hypothetical protein